MKTMSAAQAARTRAGVVGGVATLIIMLVLAVQNTGSVGVHFLLWSWTGTPLFAVILVSLLVGFLLGVLFMLSQPRGARSSTGAPAARPRRRTLRGRRATAPAATEPAAGPPAEA
jgi:uncharacterized integral membrane protein